MNVLINDSQTVYKEVLSLYNKINPCVTDLRGIGIQLSKLDRIAPVNSTISNFLKKPATIKISKEDKQEQVHTKTSYLLDVDESTLMGKKHIGSSFFNNCSSGNGLNRNKDDHLGLIKVSIQGGTR